MGTGVIATETTGTTAGVASPTSDDNNDLYRDPTPAAADTAAAEEVEPPAARVSTVQDESTARPSTAHDEVTSPTSTMSPTSPTKPGSKRLSGLLSKFKRRSRHNTSSGEPGFIGGVNLRNSESNTQSHHESTHGSPKPTHLIAGDAADDHSDVSSLSDKHGAGRGRSLERTATSDSKVSEMSEYEEARDDFNENLAPPPSFGTDSNTRNSASPVRDSKFHEVL